MELNLALKDLIILHRLKGIQQAPKIHLSLWLVSNHHFYHYSHYKHILRVGNIAFLKYGAITADTKLQPVENVS